MFRGLFHNCDGLRTRFDLSLWLLLLGLFGGLLWRFDDLFQNPYWYWFGLHGLLWGDLLSFLIDVPMLSRNMHTLISCR